MFVGRQKVRDTERSEYTAIHPAVPSPMPASPSKDTWNNPTQSFQDLCSAKETYFYNAKTSFSKNFGFRPINSRKRDNKKMNYVPSVRMVSRTI